jgi:hypothetical protein
MDRSRPPQVRRPRETADDCGRRLLVSTSRPGRRSRPARRLEQLKFDGFPSTVPANATQQRVALHGLIQF